MTTFDLPAPTCDTKKQDDLIISIHGKINVIRHLQNLNWKLL